MVLCHEQFWILAANLRLNICCQKQTKNNKREIWRYNSKLFMALSRKLENPIFTLYKCANYIREIVFHHCCSLRLIFWHLSLGTCEEVMSKEGGCMKGNSQMTLFISEQFLLISGEKFEKKFFFLNSFFNRFNRWYY